MLTCVFRETLKSCSNHRIIDKMTFTGLQLSRTVLQETKKPMNSEEIWRYAVEKGYDKQASIHGKTPWRTLGAQIYTDMQKHDDSVFQKVSTHPQKFGLKSIEYGRMDMTESDGAKRDKKKDGVFERDLHPLLVSFVNSDDHFQAHTFTIHHESSTKRNKGNELWMHPDLVSVHFPFDDMRSSSIELAKNLGKDTIKIFSFEMKRDVSNANVREYYFQAVSNSSWANEGYLVAPRISQDALNQLSRLNASFGIGVIRLNLDDAYQSEIILPSRENELDLMMIDDLSEINPDFLKFVSLINDSMSVNHFVEGPYDEVKDREELEEYVVKKHIRESI